MTKYRMVWMAALLPLSLLSAASHLLVLSGQSNMDGLKAERDFTPELQRRLGGGELVVVQDDERAQALRRWVVEWKDIAAKHGYVDKKPTKHPDGDLYLRLMEAVRAKAGKRRFDSVTFVWMQGESDAMLKGHVPAYNAAFSLLVEKLKKDLDAPRMHVVIGRLSDFGGEKMSDWETLRKWQVDYARKTPHAAWVDTDDLNDKQKDGKPVNDLHYTPEGYRELGRRFAAQAEALIRGNKPEDNGRPQ